MRVIVKSTVVVILITFLGSYLTFKVLKSQNDMLYGTKYYQIFTGYSSDGASSNDLVGSLVSATVNADLAEIRPTVLISMAGTFLLGLFAGYKIYSIEKYKRIKAAGPNLDSGMTSKEETKKIYDEAIRSGNQCCPACGHEVTDDDDEVCGDCGLSLK
ncbi:MAG: hypothetical protein ACI837_000577 [Crocinitomicaceae bacterium]|jgi:hypothetical protein